VQDHGIGMTKEEIEASLKPFWRSDRVIQEALPGTGMGLTLAHEIAHRSNMQIHFESKGVQQGVEAKIIWENSL
jgi:signal transduction histidine kinase